MENLNIKITDDTPEISLESNGTFCFSGKSLPEDVSSFYKPILSWLEEYAETPSEQTIFDFKLEYFNTASSKIILDILLIAAEIPGVLIRWHYKPRDLDMKEAGEEYSEIIEVEFEYVLI